VAYRAVNGAQHVALMPISAEMCLMESIGHLLGKRFYLLWDFHGPSARGEIKISERTNTTF